MQFEGEALLFFSLLLTYYGIRSTNEQGENTERKCGNHYSNGDRGGILFGSLSWVSYLLN